MYHVLGVCQEDLLLFFLNSRISGVRPNLSRLVISTLTLASSRFE